MKQHYELIIDRVASLLSSALKLIATVARETQVFDDRSAASDERDNMLDNHWDANNHWAAAVSAAPTIEVHNLPTKRR